MTDNTQGLDEILAKTIYDTGAKLTEIGWERWGENLEEAKQAILDWHNKQVEEVLDRLGNRVGDLEIDVEATIKHMEKLEISDDELAEHSLNLQIEADDRKAILDDILSAIEAERNKLKEDK